MVKSISHFSIGSLSHRITPYFRLENRELLFLVQGTAGRRDRLRRDSAKFRVFRENFGRHFRGNQFGPDGHAYPGGGLVQFLQHDPHFVNEIGPAFRAPRFAVVRSRCRCRSQHLPAVMVPRRTFRQFLGQCGDRCAKSFESILEPGGF